MKKKIFACITQILYIMKQHKNTHLLILYQQQESLLDCEILTKISWEIYRISNDDHIQYQHFFIFYIFYILVIFNNDDFKYLHAKLKKHCTQKEIQPKIIYSTGKWKIKSKQHDAIARKKLKLMNNLATY